MLVHRHRYDESGSDEPPEYLVVHREPSVYLDLARAPERTLNDDGSTVVGLQLTPEQALRLEEVTRTHADQLIRMAVVVGGEVVTMHKIRDTIAGGALQIFCCAQGACDFLYRQLTEHVAVVGEPPSPANP